MATSRNNDLQGFNKGKSLNETINDVMNSKTSRSAKRNNLVKLGLRPGDIQYIFSQYKVSVERTGKFDFSKLTFGIEIECYNFTRDSLIEVGGAKNLNIVSRGYTHEHTDYFKIVPDGSLTGENSNEVVTPVLKGKSGLSSLEALCKSLEEVGAMVNRSCGLQGEEVVMYGDYHYRFGCYYSNLNFVHLIFDDRAYRHNRDIYGNRI